MKVKVKLVAVAALAALVAAGCTAGGSSSDSGDSAGGGDGMPGVVTPVQVYDRLHKDLDGKKVAFIPILFKGFKITQQWAAPMQRSFESLGASFEVYDSNFDTEQMVRTLDDLIKNKKADVLIIHNPDLGVLTKQIKDAANAGIYTIVLNMSSNQSGDVFIGADVISNGEDLAKRAIADCKERGEPTDLAVLDGPGTDGFSVTFNEGVKRAAKADGAKVVDVQHTNWQADLASSASSTFIQRYGDDLCGILAPWDVIAIPAGQAVAKAASEGDIEKDSIGVYALDASSDGCDAIKSGQIRAIGAYDQVGLGAAAAIEAQRLVQTGVKPGSQHVAMYVSTVLVDKDNVDTVAAACYQGQ